jgi:hypothetical protein
METVGGWRCGVSALSPVLQRAPSDPENLRQLDIVFSDRTGKIAPALNPLSEVGDVTIEPFAGHVWEECVHSQGSRSKTVENEGLIHQNLG